MMGEEQKDKFLEKNCRGYYRNKPVIFTLGKYQYVLPNGQARVMTTEQVRKWKKKQRTIRKES